ncbi:MAG: 3-oxoacyl-ACP reductase FabG [Desulfobacterota bacterium]|jgi:3-oxoacyl-[acyl-carrier protein] reductase|nr:3-oxoacyl-ACP reductase FabG [Thermodesulfobacteriota bacterium]
MTDVDLKAQVALVTGASRGIGAATARALAAAGAHVIVNYKTSADRAKEVVDAIRSAGGSAEPMCFDISIETEVAGAFEHIMAAHKRLDILVNNAGISKDALFLRVKPEMVNEMIDVNIKGSFFCTFHAARYMIKQRSGKIVTVSSIVGLGGNPGQIVYATTKAGLIGMTKSFAKELGPRGIRVNAIAPGLVDTEMTEGIDRGAIIKDIPLRKIGSPEEVAGVILFLCSDLSAYVTGQVVVVDGGLYT